MKLMNEIESEVGGRIANPGRERTARRVRRSPCSWCDPLRYRRPCSTRSSSPTGARSRSGSSGRAARWGSRPWSLTRPPTATRCTCGSPTRTSASDRPKRASYLNVPAIISAAEITGAEAIHPGYGFLAENSALRGGVPRVRHHVHRPGPEVIRAHGRQGRGAGRCQARGRATLPGQRGPGRRRGAGAGGGDPIGYPVLVKAAAGGGGRGMRIVHAREKPWARACTPRGARRSARSGSGDVYLEKYLSEPRHVEFQVLGRHQRDTLLHLGERECSDPAAPPEAARGIARPPRSTPETRAGWPQPALAVAERGPLRERGHGRVPGRSRREFYFIEMNTRIQVEHPVTEMVTGIDLVKEQIRIARGRAPSPSSRATVDLHRPRDRVPDQRGGSRALRSLPGQRQRLDRPGRARGPRRHPADRLRGAALLRLADRQDHRPRPRPAAKRSRACGGRSRDRGRGHQDDHPLHLKMLTDPAFVAGG